MNKFITKSACVLLLSVMSVWNVKAQFSIPSYLETPLTGNISCNSPVSFISQTSTVPGQDTIGSGGSLHLPGLITSYLLTFKNGNVGIGMTNPTSKLHVEGDVVFTKSLQVGVNTAVSNGLKFLIGNDWTFLESTNERIMGYNSRFWQGQLYRVANGAASAIRMKTNGTLQLCTAPYDILGTDTLSFRYLTMTCEGKVGIGTETPLESFQIGNEWTFHNGGTKTMSRNFKYDVNNGDQRIVAGAVSGLYMNNSGDIGLQVAGNGAANSVITDWNRLVLKNNGNVGIGTISPQTKLQIGNIWTFHDGGNDKIIGRNTYYNGTNNVRMESGVASRIYFGNEGDIVMQTTSSGNAGSTISTWNTMVIKKQWQCRYRHNQCL
jgi:hypothetical protein